ncbi:MAG: DUF4870 domain-containing protein [Methylococcales bacterium]|nr:DUF4870 domain-containing protein [Methylococcales bacterium]MDP3839286.1 DUF4870 domain-containing protein [Methylococcales bacterium]
MDISKKQLTPITPDEQQARQWAMFLHLSQLAGYVIPLFGLIAPIVIWQTKKDEYPILDEHGKAVVNWIISELIYGVICSILLFVVIGFPLLLILGILAVVFPIIGGIKANNGELWHYPMTINIIK